MLTFLIVNDLFVVFETCVSCACVFSFLFVLDLQDANDALKCLAEDQNPALDSMTGRSVSSSCVLSIP